MNTNFISLIFLTVLLQYAAADYNCNGVVTTSINTNLVVDGTACTLDGATVSGQVIVKNGGNITVQGTTKIWNTMKLTGAGEVSILSNDHSIPISKIEDVDGTGRFHICGATVSGGIKVEGRNGFILVGEDTCSDTISYGPIEFSGGSGDVRLNHLKNQLSSLKVSNRGNVQVVFPNPVSSIDITDSYTAEVYDATVYDKVRFTNIEAGGAIVDVTATGGMIIDNVQGYLCVPNSKSVGVMQLINNSGGVGLFGTEMNHLSCSGNTAGGYGYAVKINSETTFSSADGQCTGLTSGTSSSV